MAEAPRALEPSTPEASAAVAQSRGGLPARAPAAPLEASVGFAIGAGVRRAAEIRPYERKKSDPIYRPLRIFALDAAASRLEGGVALVNVPYEPLGPGPEGALFTVDNRDGWQGVEYRKVELDDPRILIRNGLTPSPSEPKFHQQMVYAVASTVYAAFKTALGRDLAWGFDGPKDGAPSRLQLRPYSCQDRNAFYSQEKGEICFGYYQADGAVQGRNLPEGFVFTALSHDIVVHEVTHALLDGLRANFTVPCNRDVLAFHEAFADLVALLQRFSYKEVVLSALRKSGARIDQAELLTGLARQFGQTTGGQGPLRSAVDGSADNVTVYEKAGDEPHALGLVLVRAVADAFNTVFQRKTERYVRLATGGSGRLTERDLSTDLQQVLAEKASKLANQFLAIAIRAIDYCPPVDLKLGDFLRAVLTADYDLVPDDPWGYREAWIDAFAKRHIYPDGVSTLSEDSLLWCPPEIRMSPVPGLDFAILKFKGDPGRPADRGELERQAHALGAFVTQPSLLRYFGLARPGDGVEPPHVESIRSSRRIGPDGQIVFDLVAEITQRRRVESAGGWFYFYGGSTVILGPDAEVRYVIGKGIGKESRLSEQRGYMTGEGRKFWSSSQGRLTPQRHLFQLVHQG